MDLIVSVLSSLIYVLCSICSLDFYFTTLQLVLSAMSRP